MPDHNPVEKKLRKAWELGVPDNLVEKYQEAQRQLQNGHQGATATQGATSFTSPDLRGSAVAPGSAFQEQGETAALLAEIEELLQRFVVFSKGEQVIAVALWVMNIYVYDRWDYVPYLSVFSAEKESGKSRLLNVLELVVARPWLAVKPSESTLFRSIEQSHPTLLLDEGDSVTDANREALRGVLNAGYESGRTVARIEGDNANREVRHYDVFGPKAFAGIGDYLSDTTASRTLPIRLRRKTKTDRVEKFRKKRVLALADRLRERLEVWAPTARERLNDEPLQPEGLSDRQEDIWEPLFAIAELAGDVSRAHKAALALYDDAHDESAGVLLLRHIRDAFLEKNTNRLHTDTLLHLLANRDDGPWARWWAGDLRWGGTQRPAQSLARYLRGYEISSVDVKVGGINKKGYRREDFMDAWRRYLDDDNTSQGPSLSAYPQKALPGATPLPETLTSEDAAEKGSASGSGSALGTKPKAVECPCCGWRGTMSVTVLSMYRHYQCPEGCPLPLQEAA
jgi:hypothetical protein